MKHKSVKLAEIAELAGVSTATVSLVINNRPGVNKDTRKKVQEILKKSGFIKSTALKVSTEIKGNLLFIKYKKLGLLTDKTGFIGTISDECCLRAKNRGYNMTTVAVYADNIDSLVKEIKVSNISGILLLASELTYKDIAFTKSLELPIVFIDNSLELEPVDSVVINNFTGVYKAMNHLYALGHTEIGYIENTVRINNFHERKEGYLKSLSLLGLKYNPEFTYGVSPDMEEASRNMISILEKGGALPTAFFCENDCLAAAAVKALKEKGFKIPEDISIVGFDNIPMSAMIDPPLTTLDYFKDDVAVHALNRLIYKLESGDSSLLKTRLEPELKVRNSVLRRLPYTQL
jgi:DNA-binding LacI/PurR family transcriptional regulator